MDLKPAVVGLPGFSGAICTDPQPCFKSLDCTVQTGFGKTGKVKRAIRDMKARKQPVLVTFHRQMTQNFLDRATNDLERATRVEFAIDVGNALTDLEALFFRRPDKFMCKSPVERYAQGQEPDIKESCQCRDRCGQSRKPRCRKDRQGKKGQAKDQCAAKPGDCKCRPPACRERCLHRRNQQPDQRKGLRTSGNRADPGNKQREHGSRQSRSLRQRPRLRQIERQRPLAQHPRQRQQGRRLRRTGKSQMQRQHHKSSRAAGETAEQERTLQRCKKRIGRIGRWLYGPNGPFPQGAAVGRLSRGGRCPCARPGAPPACGPGRRASGRWTPGGS